MSIEVASNPSCTKLFELNWKLQIDCRGFYPGSTPSVVVSDPLWTPIQYNKSQDWFIIQAQVGNFTSGFSVLLSSFLLLPPIQGGVPTPAPGVVSSGNQSTSLWWGFGIGNTPASGIIQIVIGAHQDLSGVGKIPDVVLAQIVCNADPRSSVRYQG